MNLICFPARPFPVFTLSVAVAVLGFAGCRSAAPDACIKPTAAALSPTNTPAATAVSSTNQTVRIAKRFSYTPRTYPVDERGFSPVDKALAKAYAREDMVTDDAESALNPYVLKVISASPPTVWAVPSPASSRRGPAISSVTAPRRPAATP